MAYDLMVQQMDEQEIMEREEAAKAYAGEEPKHFVDYVDACVKESKEASKDIREVQDKCWTAHQSKIDYSEKEDWQSKVITNQPFITVQQAKAIVRRSMQKPDYFSIDGIESGDMDLSDFWQKALLFWLNPQHIDFPITFSDASEMGLAVGQSMEMKPIWGDRGLEISLIEPWKIFRDPDALARDPWSGNYWIHEEWLDIWKLKEGDWENTELLKPEGENDSAEEKERRKQMYWKRSMYRNYARVREFWGTILDKKGNLLLDNSSLTIAGDVIIKPPHQNKFQTLRWPGVSFSPFVHLLRFEGIGILQGVLSLWWVMCNIMNLDLDNFNWVVNKMMEIDPSMMADPTDLDRFPGKLTVRRPNTQGPIYTEVQTSANTSDMLARMQALRQQWDNGSFVNQFVAGLPGTRSNITKGEVEIKTRQSLGIFDSMGADLEAGANKILWAIYETLMLNWTRWSSPNVQRVMGKDYDDTAALFDTMSSDERRQVLDDGCDIKISGISAELRRFEKIEKLQALFEKAEKPQYEMYFKHWELLREESELYGFHDPKFLLNEEEKKELALLQASDMWQMVPPEAQAAIIQIAKDLSGGTNA